MGNTSDQSKNPNKGNGDPVQRAARDARLKKTLRDNLRKRKLKDRAVKPVADDAGNK